MLEMDNIKATFLPLVIVNVDYIVLYMKMERHAPQSIEECRQFISVSVYLKQMDNVVFPITLDRHITF